MIRTMSVLSEKLAAAVFFLKNRFGAISRIASGRSTPLRVFTSLARFTYESLTRTTDNSPDTNNRGLSGWTRLGFGYVLKKYLAFGRARVRYVFADVFFLHLLSVWYRKFLVVDSRPPLTTHVVKP